MKTLIVDYGRGNIQSVCRAIEKCGGDFILSDDPDEVEKADRLLLPGVGAFGDCIEQLAQKGFIEPLKHFAETERPFLGICVGMQILLTAGEEFGAHEGLDIIQGDVLAIPNTDKDNKPHKIPHIGWTSLEVPEGQDASYWQGTLLENTPTGSSVYFVHSFSANPEQQQHRLADSHYNGRLISAAIHDNNLTGLQFHPEKSGLVGLKIIETFLNQ